jgi:hypothetical protein
MKTLVIQTWRGSPIPEWISRCLESAKSWSRSQGYDYHLDDGSSFSLCDPEYLRAAGENIITITNLSRFLLIQNALAGDYQRAIWLDADVFVFSPDRFAIDIADRYAFAREVWVQSHEDHWIAHKGVNMAACVFCRGEPDLEFLIHAIRHVALHRKLESNYQVGGNLLKGLWRSLAFATLDNVGMFSPEIMLALSNPQDRLLRVQARFHQAPVYAANLCASGHYLVQVSPAEAMSAMDSLERSGGDVINQGLADGPLYAQLYPGVSTFTVQR